jgi:hypothetical protein
MCPAGVHKDVLGCEYSAKDKHCGNHVTPRCSELLFSSGLRKSTVQVLETLGHFAGQASLQLHNSSNIQPFSVLLSPKGHYLILVLNYVLLVPVLQDSILKNLNALSQQNTTQTQ